MIKGHFPNNIYRVMLNLLKPDGFLIFSIRDKYLHPDTDSNMGYS